MKAPWFPLYTGDFLASSDVQLMSALEVGAYCLLLMHSWQSDAPGYLANDEPRLRRLSRLSPEQWADSKDIILAKWPLSDTGLRFNSRLLHEAAQQQARRERLAENGQKGGRPPKKQKVSPVKATDNLQVSGENLQVIETEPSGLLSQPQSHTTDVVAAPPPPEPVLTAAEDHLSAETVPMLNDPRLFEIVAKRLNYEGINYEFYRKQILATCVGKKMVAAPLQFQNFIKNYLNNEPADKLRAAPPPKGPKPSHEELYPVNPDEQRREADRIRAEGQERIRANLNRPLPQGFTANTPTSTANRPC